MQLKRILNRVQKHQGFVYTDMELTQENEQPVLNIRLVPRKNSRPICSGCGHRRPG
jgi:acetolactate synthase regulatory subunit